MEVTTSPYLEAIQALAGVTPAQKHTELNSIIRKATNCIKSSGDAFNSTTDLDNVPEPLVSVVKLEVARTLKQKEIVAEALMSEDPELLNKALRTTWFFQSSNKEYINTTYFRDRFLPFAPINTRIRVIKNLVASFNAKRETALAEEFYTLIMSLYGGNQAEPLLEACSEDFIWNEVYKEKIVLTSRMLKSLFFKYPDMIIRYIKLAFPSEDSTHFNLKAYSDFYPRLIKNHSAAFIEILEAQHHCYYMNLSKKAIDRFLKMNMDAVIEKPQFFTQMIPMSIVAERITDAQYKILFANSFPEDINKYSYREVEEFLRNYPEDKRISLLLETFEKKYGQSMLDNPELITADIMAKLSVEERARQARMKLQHDDDWHKRWTISNIWRCYLPKDEILPQIKSDITKASQSDDRSCLLSQMIFVCSLNNDKNELLRFLEYFTTRHRNENPKLIYEVLQTLRSMFKLETLSKEHWAIIESFLKYLEIKNVTKGSLTLFDNYYIDFVHYKLKNNLPIEEQLKVLMESRMKMQQNNWCIIHDEPEYDKLCLEKFIEMLPDEFAKQDEKWNGNDILCSVVSEIYAFNYRIKETYKSLKMKQLSLRNYDWLFEKVKIWLTAEDAKRNYICNNMMTELWNNEPEIYKEWFPSSESEDAIVPIDKGKAKKLLKNDSAKILNRIDEYFESMKKFKNFRGDRRLFVKACTWHQEIPTKLFALCLKNLQSEDPTCGIMVLAVLVESSTFVKIVEPFMPEDTKTLDIADENTKFTYEAVNAIARGMNLARPPVPLDFVAKICDGDFLNLGLVCMGSVSRRTSVRKVENFAKMLSTCRISVKKHGIRLYCSVATIDDYRNFLTDLWKTETHRSIRSVIFTIIYQLFVNDPSLETWKIMENCISNMNVDDNDFLESILDFNKISHYFLPQYIPLVWQSFERLKEQGFDKKTMNTLTENFLEKISGSLCKFLPDEFSDKLFQKFFCLRYPSECSISVGMSFTLKGYLTSDETKFEKRLKNFRDYFTNAIKKNWDVESTIIVGFYPTNWLTQKFVKHLIHTKLDKNAFTIMQTMLDIFSSSLDDVRKIYYTYTDMRLGVAFQDANYPELLAKRFAKVYPELVNEISPGLVVEIAPIICEWIERMIIMMNLHEETRMLIIKYLIDHDKEENWILAAKLLSSNTIIEHDITQKDVYLRMRNSRFPVAASLTRKYFDIREMPLDYA